MQAPRSLSKSQTLTLESCYLFLRTLRPLLLSIGNGVDLFSREMLDEQMNLAQFESREAHRVVPRSSRRRSTVGKVSPLVRVKRYRVAHPERWIIAALFLALLMGLAVAVMR
jgi:hypothetical protein